jgi:phenylacetic acid degradation operon negative regulatory protein
MSAGMPSHAGRAAAEPGDWGGLTPSMAESPRARPFGGLAGRPKMLIMDVCGAYMRPMGGWFAVSSLIELMGELDVDEQATRSAVSRMRRRGLLVQERRYGVSGYRLSDSAIPLLEESDRRIFTAVAPARISDGWVLVSFSVPEQERDKRHVLRSRLAWLGFGNLTSGLWMAPRRLLPELETSIRGLGYERYVTMFEATHCGFEDLSEMVRQCWDLQGLQTAYVEFLEFAAPTVERWSHVRKPDGRAAFADYTSALYHWRKFPYLDPGLPLELLPAGWEGRHAADVFFRLRARLEGPALAHVSTVCSVGR